MRYHLEIIVDDVSYFTDAVEIESPTMLVPNVGYGYSGLLDDGRHLYLPAKKAEMAVFLIHQGVHK